MKSLFLYSGLWSVWEGIITNEDWWADYWAACRGGVGCEHVQHNIHYSSSIPDFFLHRKIGLYTFRTCSQSHLRMRSLPVTVMGIFLAAVSHMSCMNRLFTAVLTCMLRCNRKVTKWQQH